MVDNCLLDAGRMIVKIDGILEGKRMLIFKIIYCAVLDIYVLNGRIRNLGLPGWSAMQ